MEQKNNNSRHIIRQEKYFQSLGVRAEIAEFLPSRGGAAEYHIMLHVEPERDCRRLSFSEQYASIVRAEVLLLAELDGATVAVERFFLSDVSNQVPLMARPEGVATSFIGQPPLDGSKIALWVYAIGGGAEVSKDGGTLIIDHGGYRHLWSLGMSAPSGTSFEQTETLLKQYEDTLTQYGATLERDCIRTWFYVRDVDTQYHGMVEARKQNFLSEGLTPDTHYIASTGIGGLPSEPKALIQLGAYAVLGLLPGQQKYLYALDHLNPTIEYGVTFERGTLVRYGDREQIYISGTASIDCRGEVLFLGDIVRQTQRMWENVSALLLEGGMGFEDIAEIAVYLRDAADYALVSQMFKGKFPSVPCVILLAPVCRPAWLIEMECIALKGSKHSEFRAF